MRRWHSPRDSAVMLRRWRLEIAKHEASDPIPGFRRYGWCDLAPIPPTVRDDACHCYRGPGYFRKRHPYDCTRPRCGLCHWDKFNEPKRRAAARRAAIAYELAA